MTRDEYGTHSHMASHTLLTYAPKDLSGPASWKVPGADIQRLLNMSNNFQLQGEITPVQAWYKLRTHARFEVSFQTFLKSSAPTAPSSVLNNGFADHPNISN